MIVLKTERKDREICENDVKNGKKYCIEQRKKFAACFSWRLVVLWKG